MCFRKPLKPVILTFALPETGIPQIIDASKHERLWDE